MAGPSVLVRPVIVSGASSVDTLLPKGARWYCAHSGVEQQMSSGKAVKLQVRPNLLISGDKKPV